MEKITCIGYHDTGSSVVDDYFREFPCFAQGEYEAECRFLQDPDGVSDLEYNLVENPHRLNSGFALKRFLLLAHTYRRLYEKVFGKQWLAFVDEYIEELTSVEYDGYWHGDILILPIVKKIIYKGRRGFNRILPLKLRKHDSYNYLPELKTLHAHITEEKFLNATQSFMEKLCTQLIKENTRYILLDQLVYPCNIPRYMRYVNNLKVIIVDRDPRDVYIEVTKGKAHVLPKEVNAFCKIYRDTRECKPLNEYKDKVLYINFEDMIYKYDECTALVNKFVGLEEKEHLHPKKYFNPDISIKNTKLWERYPEYEKEVKIIEAELPEFLYSYE